MESDRRELRHWWIDDGRRVHHEQGTTRPIETRRQPDEVITTDGRRHVLGPVLPALKHFMRAEGLPFSSSAPLETGIPELIRIHQVMISMKHFDAITDSLVEVGKICEIERPSKDFDALNSVRKELVALKRRLLQGIH